MRLVRNAVGCVLPLVVVILLLLPAQASAQDKKDDEALKQLDKTSLKQAVEAAEKESKGTAVAAEVRVKGTKADVIVYVEVGGKSMEVVVDPKTGTAGKPTEVTTQAQKAEHVAKAKEISKQLADNKHKLAMAIDSAEKHSKGKAISIKPKVEGGRFDFTVRVKAEGKWQYVVIDGKTLKAKSGEGKGQKQEQKTNQPAAGAKGGKAGGQQPAGKGGAPPAGGKGGKGGRQP